MRLHITVDDALIAELDQRAGSRRRSAYITELTRRGLEYEQRWDDIEAALGAVPDEGHRLPPASTPDERSVRAVDPHRLP
jgi:hypothetical protein